MNLIKKILVPVDTNEICAEQLQMASLIAQKFDSEVVLMTSVNDKDTEGDAIAAANLILNEVKNKLQETNINLGTNDIAIAKVVEAILDSANKEDANLIILGSHNRRPGDKHNLGHIAEQVIRKSDIPVMVAKIDQMPKIEKILCPVDFSSIAKSSLNNAMVLARHFDAHLYIITAYPSARDVPYRHMVDGGQENELMYEVAKVEMENFLKDIDFNNVKHSIHYSEGEASSAIINFIDKESIDILFIGSAGRTGLSKFLLGSTTERIVRQLPTSFLTTKGQELIKNLTVDDLNMLETHFHTGINLKKNNNLSDAKTQFERCLEIDKLHLPSIYKLAHIHHIKGDAAKVQYFESRATDIISRVWDKEMITIIKEKFYN